MQQVEKRTSFGGSQEVWSHNAESTKCEMRFGIYLPPAALQSKPCHVLYFLSGLTCTEQNFITKSGFQRYAAEQNLIVVAPDTSPRGDDVPNDDAYDLGQGAGFYLNATQAPWSQHFHMYDYVTKELPTLINEHFPTTGKQSITGHSMGGHGALVLALKNPGMYQSVSAFSPIVAPSQVPWGEKAFTAYLGSEQSEWLELDTVALVNSNLNERLHLLVEQGMSDDFLENQLQTYRLKQACEQNNHPATINMREGYDHSYYFIASFIGEHIGFHAKALG